MLRCPKCEERAGMRVVANVLVDVPAVVEQITKVTLRDKQTVLLGANWDEAWFYCNLCGWNSRTTNL